MITRIFDRIRVVQEGWTEAMADGVTMAERLVIN